MDEERIGKPHALRLYAAGLAKVVVIARRAHRSTRTIQRWARAAGIACWGAHFWDNPRFGKDGVTHFVVPSLVAAPVPKAPRRRRAVA